MAAGVTKMLISGAVPQIVGDVSGRQVGEGGDGTVACQRAVGVVAMVTGSTGLRRSDRDGGGR